MSNKTIRDRFRLFGLVAVGGVMGCVFGGGPVAAQGLPPLPSMACPLIPADQAPKIDGVLDEQIWSQADLQTQFHRYYHGLNRPQDFRLLTDGEWLYIGVTAAEPAISDQNIENVSIFIAPQKDSDQFVSFSATMDSKGAIQRSPEDGDGADRRWRTAFRQHTDQWVLEMAIRTRPVFVQTLVKGKVFDFNLSRSRAPITGDGPAVDVYQQWSNTGTSSGTRYRFGEVTVGSPADRIPLIREALQQEIERARGQADRLSAQAQQALAEAEKQAQVLLAAWSDEGVLTSAAAQEYQRQAEALKRRLRRAVRADQGFLVWSCNPMLPPMPADLPPADQKEAVRLDIRVLAGEWESAALVVQNLTDATLDGRVSLGDFVSADSQTTVPGWEVLQVRTAPVIVVAGIRKRDPLPRLQEGALFRVGADENELLWLTFKSRGLAPGKYQSTLTLRSLDERLMRKIELVLRVYPLALGAEGRPMVQVWDYLVRGRDMAERAAHCRDYYIGGFQVDNRRRLPRFKADADGNVVNRKLDFSAIEPDVDFFLSSGLHTYLVTMSSFTAPPASFFWPVAREDALPANGWPVATFNFERWSPQFNELFAQWVIEFRDYLASKGLPPERWAFYIMDEPPPGENRQEVIRFAREVRRIDPRVRTYITFQIESGSEAENLEVAKYLDTAQIIGSARPEVMTQVRANVRNYWTYLILNRASSPFYAYRKAACWQSLQSGYTGTGFWVWDDPHPGSDFTWEMGGNAFFQSLYSDCDGTIIPSLRTEAFREGIEDWKYVLMLDEALAAAGNQNVEASVVHAAEAYRGRCLDELTDADSAYRFRDAARSHLLALHTAMGDVNAPVVKALETD